MLAHHRPEDGVALAGVEDLGVTGEDVARVLGPREQHDGPTLRQDADGGRVAVAAVRPRHELVTETQQPDALEDGGQPGPGGKPSRSTGVLDPESRRISA